MLLVLIIQKFRGSVLYNSTQLFRSIPETDTSLLSAKTSLFIVSYTYLYTDKCVCAFTHTQTHTMLHSFVTIRLSTYDFLFIIILAAYQYFSLFSTFVTL